MLYIKLVIISNLIGALLLVYCVVIIILDIFPKCNCDNLYHYILNYNEKSL